MDAQKYLMAGILQEHVASPVIVVGGSLVQLYTFGAVTSLDLDIVADHRGVKQVLESAGFTQGPLSFWRHPSYQVAVNVVGADVGPDERVRTVQYEGHRFQAVTPEDCLIDRLNAAKHWRSDIDWERSIVLARVVWDEMDHARLASRAQQEGVQELVDQLRAIVQA